MKKQKKQRVYFFDYLWWLGEKEHEKYPHGKMDGADLIVSYVFGFIYSPIILVVFLSPTIFQNPKIPGFIIAIFFILTYLLWDIWLYKKSYPQERRKAIMNRFANCKFSSTRAYVIMLLPVILPFIVGFIYLAINNHNKPSPQTTPEAEIEYVHRLPELIKADSALIRQPRIFRTNREQ